MSHIISPTDPEKSWCDITLVLTDSPFKTLDQVALNGLFPSKKPVCMDCLTLCVQTLLNNKEDHND